MKRMAHNMFRRRTFDECEAVILRTQCDVVLDRDKLPKHKLDGSPYQLAYTKRRWIVYTDNHPRFFGEWQSFASRKSAITFASKRFNGGLE